MVIFTYVDIWTFFVDIFVDNCMDMFMDKFMDMYMDIRPAVPWAARGQPLSSSCRACTMMGTTT
jgi:hypothetical protein